MTFRAHGSQSLNDPRNLQGIATGNRLHFDSTSHRSIRGSKSLTKAFQPQGSLIRIKQRTKMRRVLQGSYNRGRSITAVKPKGFNSRLETVSRVAFVYQPFRRPACVSAEETSAYPELPLAISKPDQVGTEKHWATACHSTLDDLLHESQARLRQEFALFPPG